MPRCRPPALALLAAALSAGPAVRAGEPGAADAPLHARVNRALDRGVAWLKVRQEEDGSWAAIGGRRYEPGAQTLYVYPAGVTSLALLTLLKCGVPPDDPVVRRGFANLERHHRSPESTYEVAALMLAIEAKANPYKRDRKRAIDLRRRGAPDRKVRLAPADRRWMAALKDRLAAWWQHGGWRYGGSIDPPFGIRRDLSNTQLAMMALHAAWRSGIDVPAPVVRETVRFTLMQQEPDGPKHERPRPDRDEGGTYAPVFDRARGWAYARGSPHATEGIATGTMTTGGLVVLLLGRSMLEALDPEALAADGALIETAVADGLAWLDRNWCIESNPPADQRTLYHFMHLYGIERVGDLLRVSLVGDHDWYDEGARWLVDRQKADGHWVRADTHEPVDILNTCFALLFLDRTTLSVTTPER